ncbi:MAG: SRPBCC domain-containing protein [Ignavibacteriales bacterium]|nr:MAG: SRPBCC domain-containing protein [Ignavibacteriales bacterium]
MLKLHFSIIIDAPKEKVWDTMLGEETYKIWTEVFMPGSHFIGSWSKGSKILFLAPGDTGEMGMVSRIEENRLHEFISIEHLGMINDGKEDLTSPEVEPWKGAHENYTFKNKGGKTELLIDTDTVEEFKQEFEDKWPIALEKLKEICEK